MASLRFWMKLSERSIAWILIKYIDGLHIVLLKLWYRMMTSCPIGLTWAKLYCDELMATWDGSFHCTTHPSKNQIQQEHNWASLTARHIVTSRLAISLGGLNRGGCLKGNSRKPERGLWMLTLVTPTLLRWKLLSVFNSCASAGIWSSRCVIPSLTAICRAVCEKHT